MSLLKRKNRQLGSAINQLQPRQFTRTPHTRFQLQMDEYLQPPSIGGSPDAVLPRTTEEWEDGEEEEEEEGVLGS